MQESQSTYGRYEGTQSYQQAQQAQQAYDGPQGTGGPVPPTHAMYDDEFVDAFAQRLSQRMAQGPRGKVSFTPYSKGGGVTAKMRLALAIVSIAMLVPLFGITVAIIAVSQLWVVGLVALGAACFTIIAINGIFNNG